MTRRRTDIRCGTLAGSILVAAIALLLGPGKTTRVSGSPREAFRSSAAQDGAAPAGFTVSGETAASGAGPGPESEKKAASADETRAKPIQDSPVPDLSMAVPAWNTKDALRTSERSSGIVSLRVAGDGSVVDGGYGDAVRIQVLGPFSEESSTKARRPRVVGPVDKKSSTRPDRPPSSEASGHIRFRVDKKGSLLVELPGFPESEEILSLDRVPWILAEEKRWSTVGIGSAALEMDPMVDAFPFGSAAVVLAAIGDAGFPARLYMKGSGVALRDDERILSLLKRHTGEADRSKGGIGQTGVRICAHPKVPARRVAHLIGLCNKAGIPQVTLVMRVGGRELDVAVSFSETTHWPQLQPSVNSNQSIHDAIGVGGGNAGAYGERWGKGALWREGGEGTEQAVRAALEWLRRHQDPDGSWKCADFVKRCSKTCQCENAAKYGEGRGFPEHDVGVTGLAVLAFAGYGHTHRDGVYREYMECLRKAVDYLLKVQVKSSDPTTNGRFGSDKHEQWIYDHAIATMAMGELLAMTVQDGRLERSVSEAVRLCIRAQNDGLGWRYGLRDGASDTSVTGWMVLALKTAEDARVEVPKADFERAFAGALNWFNRATAANGKTGYLAPGDEGSRLRKGHPSPYPYSKELPCMTALALFCRVRLGESLTSPPIREGSQLLLRHLPTDGREPGSDLSTVNHYYWHFGAHAMFQIGGRDWISWRDAMRQTLLSSQRRGVETCEHGSWDPTGEWGPAGGRVYATALNALTLQVYYRFRRIR